MNLITKTLKTCDNIVLDTLIKLADREYNNISGAPGDYDKYHEIVENICDTLGVIEYDPNVIDNRCNELTEQYIDDLDR